MIYTWFQIGFQHSNHIFKEAMEELARKALTALVYGDDNPQ